ncbi:MAG: peptide-methionine (S)-S-oxide reductase MsrA [Candidatus Omnitrophica bacterium]|nr:peptide-methionine (S)-S-oxide reductase MsrA [Candidatus Omnitrophota bacterium]
MRIIIVGVLIILGIVGSAAIFARESSSAELKQATFAGGCFWCMQPFFDRQKGVSQTLVGYTGGTTPNPTYEQVSSGKTGHAEAIQITYDPQLVSYERLLEIYWRNIDPTAKDQQFYDHGTQYRTVIFYHDDEQKTIAEDSKQKLSGSGKFKKPIVVEIQPASVFYPAEEYHQKYYKKSARHYEQYHQASGRDQFFKAIWGRGDR